MGIKMKNHELDDALPIEKIEPNVDKEKVKDIIGDPVDDKEKSKKSGPDVTPINKEPVKDPKKPGPNDPINKDPVKDPKKPGPNDPINKDPVKDPKKPGPNVDPKDGVGAEPFKIFLLKDVPDVEVSGLYATAVRSIFKRLVEAGNVSGAVDYDLTAADVKEMCRLIAELSEEKILTRKNTMDLFFEISEFDLVYYIDDEEEVFPIDDDDDKDMKN